MYRLVYSMSPNCARACLRASWGGTPASMSSWVFMSRWKRSSSSTSRCTRAAETQGRRNARRRPGMRGMRGPRLLRRGLEHLEHRFGVLAPFGRFGAELLSTGGGELVILRPPVVLGEPPLGLDEAFALEAVKGLVESGVFDGQDVVGALTDPARDAVAMHRFPGQRLENQDVERSLEEVHGR